jgi:transposase
MFSYVDLESRVPEAHPIRKIRRVVDKALKAVSPEFDQYYSEFGRVSIPPEMLLRAQFLQIFYSIRSERQLVERIDYDLLFRGFVGMGIDDPVWNHSTFSKNRDRVLSTSIAERLFEEIKKQAYAKRLMSRDHFSVDGTLIDASASMKSFVPKDPPAKKTNDQDGSSGKRQRNAEADFKNQKRSNETHQSTTDTDARLFKKSAGSGARLCMMGHIVTENRNGMIVEATVTKAGTSQEWNAGLEMLGKLSKRPGRTVGADKGYDTKRFVQGCRDLKFTAHVAARKARSAVDARTTSTPAYQVSQVKRKRVEEPFGWMKTVGSIRKSAYRGLDKTRAVMLLNCSAFNIIRMTSEC